MKNPLEKLFLAAVGTTTLTYEKAQETVNELIEKGKLTVEEGRDLTKDLKKKFEVKSQGEEESRYEELAAELLKLRQQVNELQGQVEHLNNHLNDA